MSSIPNPVHYSCQEQQGDEFCFTTFVLIKTVPVSNSGLRDREDSYSKAAVCHREWLSALHSWRSCLALAYPEALVFFLPSTVQDSENR